MFSDILRHILYVALANHGGKIGIPPEAERMPPLFPRELFYDNPDVYGVGLSPDGDTVAFIKPLNGVLNVWVQAFDELLAGVDSARHVTNDTGRGVRSYRFTHLKGILLYSQDKDGDENWKLYKLDLNEEPPQPDLLTDTEGVQASILAGSRDHPDQIIIGLNNRDPRYHDPYRVNLTTGLRELMFENNKFSGYIFDHNLRPRLATSEDEHGNKLYSLPPIDLPETEWGNASLWSLYRQVDFDDSDTTYLLNFDKTNERVYWVDSIGRDLGVFTISDFDDADQENSTILYAPGRAETGGVFWHATEHIPLTVVENYDKPHRVILDDSVTADFEYLSNLEDNNGFVAVAGTSTDMKKWVVVWRSDTQPSKYYIYDRTLGKATYLFSTKQALLDLSAYMSPMYPVDITTRDNLTQLCYVTVPYWTDTDKDGIPAKPLPMVLNPHGGPWARDTWGFSTSVQLRANRGHVVMQAGCSNFQGRTVILCLPLQCNYRGSTGFGKAFLAAGNGEWAAAMHDDLIDAVQWAIDKGVADPAKVAISGGSYGGYATLVGLTYTPEVFACGIDIVGPSNLITLLETIPDYWQPLYESMVRRIGASPKTEQGREYLKSRSPFYRVDQIVKPLLIAQGANDPRVKQNESDQIVDALIEHNIPVTYLLFPNEGHGFARPENKLAYAAVSDQFFSHCLGGRAQPILDELSNSLVQVLQDGILNLADSDPALNIL